MPEEPKPEEPKPEAVGRNLGSGRLNRWLLKIIGPANVGSRPTTGAKATAEPSPDDPPAAEVEP